MRVNHVCQNGSHALIAGFKLLDCLLNRRDKVLFAISGHFGVHSIALATMLPPKEKTTKVSDCTQITKNNPPNSNLPERFELLVGQLMFHSILVLVQTTLPVDVCSSPTNLGQFSIDLNL